MGLVVDEELGRKWGSLRKRREPFYLDLVQGTILPPGLLHVGKTPKGKVLEAHVGYHSSLKTIAAFPISAIEDPYLHLG